MSENLVLSERHGRVTVLRLNRPEKHNALCAALVARLNECIAEAEGDTAVGAVVVTGDERAFAAGADIAEMVDLDFPRMLDGAGPGEGWDRLADCAKPTVAAVAGHALGGGCELAMMCDIILAADNARFGQPEINLGVIPGLGGTQRLARLVGRAKAMDLCLTGRTMDAEEAERSGLVSRVVPAARLLEEAISVAGRVADHSRRAVRLAREAIRRADEVALREGLLFERRVFQSLFATEDQTEGMRAFLEKRRPLWRQR